MFDISEIAEKGDFIYWFKRQHIISDTWEVYQNTSEGNQYNLVALYDEECDEFNIMEDLCQLSPDVEEKIKTNFLLYKESRPEYHVGKPIRFNISTSTQDLGHKYDAILAGAILSQANSDSVIPKVDKCLKWLHSTDFYVAPGSTIYHNSEVSGLLVHSLQVYNKVLELSSLPSFSSVNIFEAIIVALSHDWCKIELYEKYMRNVKDETTGAWKAVPSFRRLPPKLPFGHGASSLFIAQKFFNVSTEMALALRWHMGHWYCTPAEEGDLQTANENYPMVHMIQFADQLSIVNYS